MTDAEKLQSEVVDLLGQVPIPPDQPAASGISSDEISAFEKRVGLNVPNRLRSWLMRCNSACVGPGGIFGINTDRDDFDIEELLDQHSSWKAKGWLPIAGDGCGNYYVVDTNIDQNGEEPVIFVDTMEDDSIGAFVAASNVWQFLRFLLKKELGESNWPFDQSEVLSADPQLSATCSIPLPWDS